MKFNRIYIEITNICNLNCKFCPSLNRKQESMSSSNFEKIILKIKDYTNHIYLHVKGEPLIHKDLDKILKIANKYNLNVNITTNGRLLESKLDIINNNKVRQINISLHSFDNVDEIYKLLDVIDKINNTYISLRIWDNNDKLIKLLEEYYSKHIEFKNKRFKINNNIFIDKDIRFKWPNINGKVISEYGTCKGGKSHIAILVDGTVTICCLDNDGIVNLGNIFSNTLEEILDSDRYKNIINGFNNNKLCEELCKKCDYRNRFN